MPKLKSFISSIAKKANVDLTTDEAKAWFDALPDSDVPETINTGIDNTLLSVTDAKNNHPEIKGHYTAQVLSSVDSSLNTTIEELGFDDATKAEILAERSSYKRAALIAKKAQELEKGKAKGGNNATQQEIDRLHAEIAAQKAANTAAAAAFAAENTNRVKREKLMELVGKDVLPTKFDDMPVKMRFAAIESAIKEELAANGADLNIDQNGNLTLVKNDGSTFYTENHQAQTPKAFVESALTRNKIIAVSTVQTNGAGKTILPANANGAAGKNDAQTGVSDYNRTRAKEMLAALKEPPLAI